ncbi:MAG: ComF family protein [Pseudomonadota bacterium]|nr:ComF family protein [Pseudomonadota bacterium]
MDHILPQRCPLCREQARYGFCVKCQLLLPWIEASCPQCGTEMPKNMLCGACQKKAPRFGATTIPFHYAEPVDRMIQNLKYNGQLYLSGALGKMIAISVIRRKPDLPDMLLPVPLHRSRLRKRGYNQSLEIAREISRQLSIPVNYKLAERTRSTVTQTGLTAPERRRNVRGAFSVSGTIPRQHFAIVDDVVTSGSTANELARTLMLAGAERVSIFAVSRA